MALTDICTVIFFLLNVILLWILLGVGLYSISYLGVPAIFFLFFSNSLMFLGIEAGESAGNLYLK